MAITKQQARRLRNLMTRRVTAAIAHAWKGSKMPDEWPQLEEDLSRAEENLDKFVKELTE